MADKDFTTTAKAASDLSAKQYHLMRNTAARTVDISTADTQVDGLGVLLNKPQANESATVQFGGTSYVVAGGAISANVQFTTNASGRATAASSGDFVYGRTLEASAADGDKIQCVLNVPWFWK